MKMLLHLRPVLLSSDSYKSLFSRLVGDGKELFFFFLLLRELFVSRTICHLTRAFISQSVGRGPCSRARE